MDDENDELADAIRDLTEMIEALRTELGDSRRRPPLGLPAPRPPTPGDLIRFTDDVALPAMLATLEASVRTLEAFQRGISLIRTERTVREDVRERLDADTSSPRARDLRTTTLSQLDTVLSELQRAASDDRLPIDEDARDLLTEARELRDDVDRRLREASPDKSDRGETIEIGIDEIDDENPNDIDEPDAGEEIGIDVDAELETLKDQYAPEDPPASDDERDTDDGDDGSGDLDTENGEPGERNDGNRTGADGEHGTESGSEDGDEADESGDNSGVGDDTDT